MQVNYHRLPEKTTVKSKIFSTFWALAALLTCPGGEITTAGEAPPRVPEEFLETAQRIVKLFRITWRRSPSHLTVAFSPAVPERSAELELRKGRYILMLNGSPGLERDFDRTRKVYGALLLAAAGAEPPRGDTRALPPWVAAALERILAARRAEERLLVGNRRSPVLRALMARGKLPEPAAVLRVDPGNFDPAARFWAEEACRALFYAGGKRLASSAYLLNCAKAERQGADPDRFWLPEAPGKLERNFRTAARVLAWHELAPRPARWALRRFAELRKLRMPELDDKGEPIPDRFVEFDVLEVADRLKDRPDAAERSAEFRRRFFEFAAGDSHSGYQAITGLAELVALAADPPFRYGARLRRQVAEIEEILKRREAVDDCLAAADLRYAAVRRAFRRRLECIEWLNARSPLLGGAERAWVDKCEAEFR